jgi:hypothetical protein
VSATEPERPPPALAAAVDQLYGICRRGPPTVLIARDAVTFARLLAATGGSPGLGLPLVLGLGSLVPGGIALIARASGESDPAILALLLVAGVIVLLTAFGPNVSSEPTLARVRADRLAVLLLVGGGAALLAAAAGSFVLGIAAFACLTSLAGALRALVLANGGIPGRLDLARRTGASLARPAGQPIADRLARSLEAAMADRQEARPRLRPAAPMAEEAGWNRLEEIARRRLDWMQVERAVVAGRLLPARRRHLLAAAAALAEPPPVVRAMLLLDGRCDAAALFERVAVILLPGPAPAAEPAPRWWRAGQAPYAEVLALLHASPAWHALIALLPTRRLADKALARVVVTDPDPALRLEAIERIGFERFFAALGTAPVDRSAAGALFVTRSPSAPTALVRVEDAVHGPDGAPRVHWLPVPPHIATAREAVAWTFGKSERDYQPVVET